MPTAKKATAPTAEPKKKETPPPRATAPEGFSVEEYPGVDEMLDSLVCDRCGFQTFDVGSAKTHAASHASTDAEAEARADLEENLAEHAQVTTTEATDG